MLYYNLSIYRSGVPYKYSSNMYEQLHVALMKIAYIKSNKKYWHIYIVKLKRRLQLLQEKSISREGFKLLEKRDTSLWYVLT
jgi:hypothetical protein